jgi:hypothetical protein
MKITFRSLLSILFLITLLMLLALPRMARAQTLSGTATNVDIPTEVAALIGQMPESSSWTNTSIKIDAGLSILGIGQTGTAEALLRGTYNVGPVLGIGLEGDFGAGNTLDACYLTLEAHKDLSAWAEVFATGGGGYSWLQHGAQGFFGVGTRVIPIGSIPQVAVWTELDFILNEQNTSANNPPSQRLAAGLTYHF